MSERVSGNDYTLFCAFITFHVRSKTVIKSHTSHNPFLDFGKNGITMVSRNKKKTHPSGQVIKLSASPLPQRGCTVTDDAL